MAKNEISDVTTKELYHMDMHEVISGDAFIITKVHKGWIYELKSEDGNYRPVFVPMTH